MNTNTNTTAQQTIDFPVWKTVTHCNTCGHNYHNFDLVRLPASYFGVEGSEEIAIKALELGLEFAPFQAVKALQREYTEQEVSDMGEEEGLFVMNRYGEVCFLSFLDGKWTAHGNMNTYGFGPKAPLVFVKSRKSEKVL